MESLSWSLSFVPPGTTLDRPLPPNTIAVDVGNGDPDVGIYDHHHRKTDVDCAAELILQRRSKVLRRLKDTGTIRLIGHQSPDLDCLASLFLVWLLGTAPPRLSSSIFGALTEYVGDADQGRLQSSSELTLYSYALTLPVWLDEKVDESTVSGMDALIDELDIRNESRSTDLWAAALSINLLDELTRLTWAPKEPLPQKQMSPVLRPVLDGTSALLQGQWTRSQEELRRIRQRGDFGRMDVRARDGTVDSLPYVRVVDPEANPGLLVKYIRLWAHRRHDQPVVTIVQFPTEARSVISVNPEFGYTLKGLGLYLDLLERKNSRVEESHSARDGDNLESSSSTGDPLSHRGDPWYDGRGHNFTIVDAPRAGSALSPDQVFREVVDSEWLDHATQYGALKTDDEANHLS